ncbi:electron transport complex protein RnfD [Breznakibacter xylanolyticus]|uniref:Ion-translocating oxidoreductase complex subunit D n=1 Tax=Breznakibacter xylanolyticus TaxID=990 RepID=A0A2W7MYR0_9BACT|nr:RnfABCDGE type electron transport complex subunit D [Breznakibacter xylanolyticus]PZX12960.1 electron transport complex protein RnfD [Breznakibacter xylanolyticus]
MNKLTVSPSPHVHSGDSVKKNMYGVIIALMPALLASLWFFGVGALVVTLTSVAACLLFEFLIQKYLLNRAPSILDGSAIITGLLLAFNLPSNLPIALIIIGAAVSIGIGKMAFGGLGNNPFNPALVGRVFLLISFPVQMTSWPLPIASRMSYVDALTGATPLAVLKEGVKSGQSMAELTEKIPSSINLFLGNMGGSLGEVAAIALIIGLAYMLIRRIITWHIPVSVIATVLIFTGILHLVDPQQYVSPLFHLLTGGLLLGAIFMATDYVTSPMSHPGMIVFGVGIGVITVLIRVFGAYPEGVSFAILIMNAFTPLINKYIKPKAFGEVAKPVKA